MSRKIIAQISKFYKKLTKFCQMSSKKHFIDKIGKTRYNKEIKRIRRMTREIHRFTL